MLTGVRAFQRESALATLSAILHQEPPPIHELIDGVPRELATLIVRCLRKDPRRRIQVMDDVRLYSKSFRSMLRLAVRGSDRGLRGAGFDGSRWERWQPLRQCFRGAAGDGRTRVRTGTRRSRPSPPRRRNLRGPPTERRSSMPRRLTASRRSSVAILARRSPRRSRTRQQTARAPSGPPMDRGSITHRSHRKVSSGPSGRPVASLSSSSRTWQRPRGPRRKDVRVLAWSWRQQESVITSPGSRMDSNIERRHFRRRSHSPRHSIFHGTARSSPC